jgi:hypothetical protein
MNVVALCKHLTQTGGNMTRLIQFPSYESKFKITASSRSRASKTCLDNDSRLYTWNGLFDILIKLEEHIVFFSKRTSQI